MAADLPRRRHEVLGIVAAASAILLGLALASYDARSVDNLAGPVGAGVAGTFVAAFGVAAWLLPFELAAATIRLFRGRGAILGVATVVSTLVITLVGCSLLHLALLGHEVHGGHLPGGVLGEVLGEVLRSLFGTAGAYVLTITILLITLVLRTRLTITGIIARVRVHGAVGAGKVRDSLGRVAEAWREARELERQEREAELRRRLADSPNHNLVMLAPTQELRDGGVDIRTFMTLRAKSVMAQIRDHGQAGACVE